MKLTKGIITRAEALKISADYRAIDGPLVRLGNGEYTWRVDGSNLAFPIKKVNVIELKGNNYESVLSRINDMDIRFFRNDFRTF